MAGSLGLSRVLRNRRFEDYKSMKQAYQHRTINEFIISGRQVTTNAAAEIDFTVGDTINYIAAEAQACIRTEAADANQKSKYVYMRYCSEDGTISSWVTADLDGTNTTTEVAIGGADFFRLREMYCEVVSDTGGGKAVLLTDAEMGGADDIFGFIDDDHSQAAVSRYYVPAAAQVEHTYLGRITCISPNLLEGDATPGGMFLTVLFTPKVLNGGEAQVAAEHTEVVSWMEDKLVWEPCIELEPATDVTIKIHKLVDADHVVIHIEAIFLEVLVHNSTPSS